MLKLGGQEYKMYKQITVYVIGALVVLLLLWLWHEKDKEVDALNIKLNQANTIITEINEERTREQLATKERDISYGEQDKKLNDLSKQIRNLAKSNAELKAIMLSPVPIESLRLLRGYSNKHETKSP